MTASPAPDIWGKDAITQSWDQLVEDYKVFYHVRAQGGTLADLPESLRKMPEVIKGPDAKSETGGPSAVENSDSVFAEALAEAQHERGAETESLVPESPMPHAAEQPTAAADLGPPAAGPHMNIPVMPGLMSPQMVLGNGENEGLRKLLLSWYYAGYYTGLYEGQQQAAQQAQPTQQVQQADQHDGDAIQP